MILAAQGIALIAIAGLGIFVFRRWPLKIATRSLARIGLLLGLALALSYLSVMVGLFGFPSFKIGFAQVPLILIGLWFGPSAGFLAGLAYDLLGLLVTPTDLPFLGFTLTNILTAALPGIIMAGAPDLSFGKMRKLILAGFGGLLGLAVAYLWTYTRTPAFCQGVVRLSEPGRFGLTVLAAAYYAVLWKGLNYLSRRQAGAVSGPIIAAVLAVEAGVNLLLNPLWLNLMYGIPYLAGFFVRSLKILAMIPLDTLIISALWRALGKAGLKNGGN